MNNRYVLNMIESIVGIISQDPEPEEEDEKDKKKDKDKKVKL